MGLLGFLALGALAGAGAAAASDMMNEIMKSELLQGNVDRICNLCSKDAYYSKSVAASYYTFLRTSERAVTSES